jgi:hypothetical protein
MKITKRQLMQIIKEEKEQLLDEIESATDENGDHHWPRVEWTNVDGLVDKWAEMEEKSFDEGDPSMNADDMSVSDSKAYWAEQVESAAMDLEADLVSAVRKLSLAKMKEYTERLINGDYG